MAYAMMQTIAVLLAAACASTATAKPPPIAGAVVLDGPPVFGSTTRKRRNDYSVFGEGIDAGFDAAFELTLERDTVVEATTCYKETAFYTHLFLWDRTGARQLGGPGHNQGDGHFDRECLVVLDPAFTRRLTMALAGPATYLLVVDSFGACAECQGRFGLSVATAAANGNDRERSLRAASSPPSVFFVGLPKTGSTSLFFMTRSLAPAHEFLMFESMHAVVQYERGAWTRRVLAAFHANRRRQMVGAGIDISTTNHRFVDVILDALPDAKLIFTIREPYAWVNSVLKQLVAFMERRLVFVEPNEFSTPKFIARTMGIFTYPHPFPVDSFRTYDSVRRDAPTFFHLFLEYWARWNDAVFNALAARVDGARNTLILKTDELSSAPRLAEIAAFFGLNPGDMPASLSGLQQNKADVDEDVLSGVDRGVFDNLAARLTPPHLKKLLAPSDVECAVDHDEDDPKPALVALLAQPPNGPAFTFPNWGAVAECPPHCPKTPLAKHQHEALILRGFATPAACWNDTECLVARALGERPPIAMSNLAGPLSPVNQTLLDTPLRDFLALSRRHVAFWPNDGWWKYIFEDLVSWRQEELDVDALIEHLTFKNLNMGELIGVAVPGGLRVQNLYMGAARTGSAIHHHSPAINVLAVGVKLWVLWPPTPANVAATRHLTHEDLLANISVEDWLLRHLPELRENVIGLAIFLQRAGDVVLVPDKYFHAVINLGFNAGFTYSWFQQISK